jgi:hypothetical protein
MVLFTFEDSRELDSKEVVTTTCQPLDFFDVIGTQCDNGLFAEFKTIGQERFKLVGIGEKRYRNRGNFGVVDAFKLSSVRPLPRSHEGAEVGGHAIHFVGLEFVGHGKLLK